VTRLYVSAVLRIDCGDRWREPTADYWCHACGQTESAQGTAAVIEFTRTIRETHATRCTPPTPER
jgi:hypothetical protein